MSTLKIKRENGKIFCPLADSWHIETPEEKVRQEYIKILVEDYGYSLDQMAQEIKVNNSQRGQGKARADIVIWKSKQDKIESKAAFIVVECKAENVRIREEDYYQGYNYASWAGASFFVTTNEKETKYFNVDKDYLPKELVEVVAIPTAEEALNDKKVKDILSKTKTFTRDDFTKILRTCHNIIRNNDKLSPEAAFDEISKILFMKIKYEREQRGAKVFTKNEFEEKEKWFEKEIRPSLKGTPKDLPYMQFLFYNTKEEFKDDQLFEENEIIKIRQNSFEQILEKLETYNLSDTQDDVKVITKTDLAKVRNTWSEMPHIVSKGAQTNFMKFAELIDEAWTTNDSQFNERYFTESVALVILFKHLEALIPRQEWYEQGYRANIVTYVWA